MLDFIFDVGFDALMPGRSGERSRAHRAAKTLEEFARIGTVTFPGAIRTTSRMTDGYLTLRRGSIVFSRVSGGGDLAHTEIDLGDIRSFWSMTNETRTERDVNRWWTLVRLQHATVRQGDLRPSGGTRASGVTVLACAPNGSTSLLEVLADLRIPQLEP